MGAAPSALEDERESLDATAAAISRGLLIAEHKLSLSNVLASGQTPGSSASYSQADPTTPPRRFSRAFDDDALSNPEYETTFKAMTNRRLLRQYHGTHKPSRLTFALWSCAFLAIIAGFATVSFHGTLAVKIDV